MQGLACSVVHMLQRGGCDNEPNLMPMPIFVLEGGCGSSRPVETQKECLVPHWKATLVRSQQGWTLQTATGEQANGFLP